MLHLHVDLGQRQLKAHAPFRKGEHDDWTQILSILNLRGYTSFALPPLLLCPKSSQSCSTLSSPPTPPAALHAPSAPPPPPPFFVQKFLLGSLMLEKCWAYLPSHATHLVQLSDRSIPPALLGVLLATIPTQLLVAGCDLHRLSHWLVPHPFHVSAGQPTDPLCTCPTGTRP